MVSFFQCSHSQATSELELMGNKWATVEYSQLLQMQNSKDPNNPPQRKEAKVKSFAVGTFMVVQYILLFSEHVKYVQLRRREDHPKRVRLRIGDDEQFQQI